MCPAPPEAHGCCLTEKDVVTMIEWGSENWGGNVHYASNGSWVPDRHAEGTPDDDE